jgi:uncharacterized protein (DUF697 family)
MAKLSPVKADLQTTDRTDSPTGGGDVLLRVSHHALLAGLCQFIPVPFADDVAQQRVLKSMVAKILARHGREADLSRLAPLYAGPRRSIVGKAASTARSLVLKPLRKVLKTVLFVFTIRRALLDATEALMLGHSADRLLADGFFDASLSADELGNRARLLHEAVEGAMRSPERRTLLKAVRSSAKLLRAREQQPDGPATLDALTSEDARDVEAALKPPARRRLDQAAVDLVKRLTGGEGPGPLERFDHAIDLRLNRTSGP